MADTIGYKLGGRNTGKLSDVVTNSFYASHIINGVGTGGIVCFNDFKLYQKAKLLEVGEDHQQHLMSQKISVKDLILKFLA